MFGITSAHMLIVILLPMRTFPELWLHTLGGSGLWLSLFFISVLLAHGQINITNSLWDYPYDRNNALKRHLPASVDAFGKENCKILALVMSAVSAVISLAVGILYGKWVLPVSNLTLNLVGFFYSRPPRLKERGFLGLITTSGAETFGVVLTGMMIFVPEIAPLTIRAVAIIFLYTLTIHAMHQAADATPDMEMGVRTFATVHGASQSVALSAILSLLYLTLSIFDFPLVSIAALFKTVFLIWLYQKISGLPIKNQGTEVASRWNTRRWSMTLNLAVPLDSLTFGMLGSHVAQSRLQSLFALFG